MWNVRTQQYDGKQYLGDSVYVDIEQGQIVLTTENGVEVFNTICLNQEVAHALWQYLERIRIATTI